MSTPALASGERPAQAGADPSDRPHAFAPRLLTDLLDHAVDVHGARTVIDFLGRTWSYAEIGALVERAARGLQNLGVTPGTRVGLCLPNTHYYVILYFAVLRIGGIVVNINPLYIERELCHLLKDSGATVVAVSDITAMHARMLSVVPDTDLKKVIVCPIGDALPTLQSIGYRIFKRADIAHVADDGVQIRFADLIADEAAPVRVTIAPDEVAVLQYTGGTTGVPKATMLTHANLVANAEQEVTHTGGERPEQDRVIGVLPLFHVFALTSVLNFSIRVGAEMILLPRFELKQLLATLKRTRPTYFPAVPTIYGAINHAPETKSVDWSSLRACISGGAPLPLEVKQAFEALTGSEVVEGYGLSEASPIIACNPIGGANKAGSAGPAFPGTILEIRDLEDPTRVLPQGERGEICARGPQVMKGYWHRSDDTAAVFVDGALRTGDVGYLDEDGYLFLVDRIKDVILAGGYNVYPRVIEEALYEHPAIAEAVVIGVTDKYRGQAPKAFVTLKAGQDVTPDALKDFLKDKINKIEMPREIEIRESLPKTLIGKLSKKELVAEEQAKTDG
jgi:long-chain acyl-CoA synthetase